MTYSPFTRDSLVSHSGWTEMGVEGGLQASIFLDLYSKNFKILQIIEEFFFYLVLHKKIASVHPEVITGQSLVTTISYAR